MSVHRKLMQARMKLQAQPVKKSGRNTFANYSYMELADFLIPTQTIFAELDLCGVVSFTADIASLTITDMEDGTSLVITSPMGSAALKGCHEVQNIGAVETYQRRYLWVTAMEIVEHDALDSAEPAEAKSALEATLEASISLARETKLGARAAAAKEAGDRLDANTKTALRKLSEQVAATASVPDAYDLIKEQGLTDDEREYLWDHLSSKIRSALKTEGQIRALKHNQPEHA